MNTLTYACMTIHVGTPPCMIHFFHEISHVMSMMKPSIFYELMSFKALSLICTQCSVFVYCFVLEGTARRPQGEPIHRHFDLNIPV